MSSAVVLTQVEICNDALGLVGSARIQSIDDDTTAAIECKARFDMSLNHVLRLHPWQFATRHVQLAQLGEPVPPPWTFLYAAPADSVLVRRLYDTRGSNVPFRTYDNRILACESSLWTEYTRKVEVVALPHEVGHVVACHLAYSIAPVFAANGQHSREALYVMFERELSRARFVSAHESGTYLGSTEDWTAARYQTLGGLHPYALTDGQP